jgi:hypothetical protein
MWQVPRPAALAALLGAALFCAPSARADSTSIINQNVTGFNLPGVQLPQGHDEVRAADGTTCRSAISGAGAYFDAGVIGNPAGLSASNGVSAYGRIVVPLGRRAQRLDCSRLYELEIQRLQMEVKLMQMGLGESNGGLRGTLDDPPESAGKSWTSEGWSTRGKSGEGGAQEEDASDAPQ